MCVCDVSHGDSPHTTPSRIAQYPLWALPCRASPCSAAGTSNRIATGASGRVRVGKRDLETRPGSKKRGPNQQVDPAAQLTKMTHSPVPTRPMLFLSRAGRHRWSSRGGPLPLSSPSGRRGQSAAAEPNSNPFGIVHAGGRGWLAVRACARLIATPCPGRPGHAHGPWDSFAQTGIGAEGARERGAAIVPCYGVGWQITGAKIPRPTPLGFSI